MVTICNTLVTICNAPSDNLQRFGDNLQRPLFVSDCTPSPLCIRFFLLCIIKYHYQLLNTLTSGILRARARAHAREGSTNAGDLQGRRGLRFS